MASTSSGRGRGRLKQVHRLVAEALVGVGDERRRCRTDTSGRPGCHGRRLSDHVPERALEEPIDALPARIHDPGLAQDREQGRCPRHGLLGRLDRRGQHGGEIVVDLGCSDGGLGRLADDGQDRALDRLCDRGIGRLRVPSDRACARSRPLKRRLPSSASAMPRKIWLVITPELPRAPMSAP